VRFKVNTSKPALCFAVLMAIYPGHGAVAQSLDIVSAERLSATACLNHISGNGAENGFLLNYGYKKRGRKFVHKASKFAWTGHSDLAEIKMTRTGCETYFGDGVNAHAAVTAFTQTLRDAGLPEAEVRTSRRIYTAFQIGNTLYKVSGSSGSANSSYFTRISLGSN
jgi:hypothetical protein